MGHVVSPIAFRLNFSKYWLNLHSEKKNSNYLNFSDYVLLVSLKRLLKKRIFFRFKLVFDKLIFIHRFWQDLLMIKFKYSKYKITKKSKKKIIRNKKKKKSLNLKKKIWNASRSYYGMFARIRLQIALSACFDFFKKPNFSNYLFYIKKPFSIKESSYHKLAFMFSSKFFRWYDKPLFIYKFSDYFFKFVNFRKNVAIFFKKKKLVSNFTIKDFKKSGLVKHLKKNSLINGYTFFFNKSSSVVTRASEKNDLVDFNFFRFHYAKPRFFNYSKKSFRLFCSAFRKYYYFIGSASFRKYHSALRSRHIADSFWLRKIGKPYNKKISFFEKKDNKKTTANFFKEKTYSAPNPLEILLKENKYARERWLNLKSSQNQKKKTITNNKKFNFFFNIQKKNRENKFDNNKTGVKILSNVSEKTLKILRTRKLVFNIFNYYNSKPKKKFNYRELVLHKQSPVNKSNNHSMEYTIFYKPLKEALDLILSGRKLLKKNRKHMLSYFINMPIWDRLSKEYSIKKKDLFWKFGKLPFKLTRLRRRINNPFFKKEAARKKNGRKTRKIKRLKKNFGRKLLLSLRRNRASSKKSSNINFLLLELINRQKIDKSKNCTKESLRDLLAYNYSVFSEEAHEFQPINSSIARYSKKINFKNSKIAIEDFFDKSSFSAKRKLLFKIGNLLFIETLNNTLGLRYNFNSLIKLQRNLKKYKKKYYSKRKKKFGILRYNSGFSDRVKTELRRCMNSFFYLKKGRRFLNYIRANNFFKRFSRINYKKKTKWSYYSYKKYMITKVLHKSSIFRKQKILNYYKLRRHSRRFYKSTFWFFKNKTYLKKFFKFFKIKNFQQVINIKRSKMRFTYGLEEKKQSAKCSVYSESLKKKQYDIFYYDFIEEKERQEALENFSTEFKARSVQDRLNSLIKEYNMAKNFATDPGLKMLLLKKYKKNNVNSVLNSIKKKIKTLERSKGKHNVYQKQNFSSRKYRRRLWYNAKKTIKESKNPDAIFKAETQLYFLKYLKLKEERERVYKRMRIFKSVKYLFNKTRKFKFFYLKNYYANKMFILSNSYTKIGVKIKILNFLNLERYFLENYFFKKKSYRMLDDYFFHLNKELILLDYFKDVNFFNRKEYNTKFFFFSNDIFTISFDNKFKYTNPKFFYKNKFWINFIWNFYFSAKKSFYNRYFIKFFKKIYKLKMILLNFINNFCFSNNTKIYFFIFKKKFIPAVTSFLNFFFYRIKGIKVKYHVKKTLRLLEKYFKYKIFSGYKFCLSGRYSRKDRAEFNWVRDGLLPLTDKFSPVYYGFYFNSFRYGAVNVKFWILLKSLKRRNRVSPGTPFLMNKI